jgi:phosphatidylglycerol:prolipoprotein diacylglycerol transferase
VPYVHDIDPIVLTIGGVHLWWYGLSYAAGFFNAHLFLRRNRARLGLSLTSVYDLTLCLAVGVLAGGRSLVVFVNEWPFYREHLRLVPAMWLGGLATHGLILGGALGVMAFCAVRRTDIRPVFDALAVAAALVLACGRVGNFIDGQIVGSLTSVPWAVKFPDADGFRHPVVLYDGLKNLLLVPLFIAVGRRNVPSGRIAALFVLLYPALRIPIDVFRDYRAESAATGQTFNIIMAAGGALLLARNWIRTPHADRTAPPPVDSTPHARGSLRWRRAAFAAVLALSLVIPSDSTRDIPAHYGKRHPGLAYSALYRKIAPTRLPEIRQRAGRHARPRLNARGVSFAMAAR